MMIESILIYAKKLRVLLVDDDKEVQKSLKSLLEVYFNKVEVASDGIEALSKFKKNRYDILFIDIELPKLNGIELSKKIKLNFPFQKIVMITGYDKPTKYFYDLLEIGVDGFLLKPINKDKLEKLIIKIVKVLYLEKLNDLRKKMFIDPLTRLKNRNSLLKDIKKSKIIYLLNVNNFDSVNIVYGYEVGDRLLKYIANFLKRLSNKVYYLGNDEFAILDKINLKSLEMPPFKLDEDHFFPIDFTIGIARDRDLLKRAYLALKEAKKKKKKYLMYSEDLEIEKFHKKVQHYLPILKEALKNNQVVPFFQGIYDNKLKKITKYEVLARIKHKNEVISPYYFIDIAEKGGLIVDITKQIIDKSFQVFSNNDYTFSINLTEMDLSSDELIRFLIKKVKEYNINKNRVVLEVLEGIGEIDNNIILDKLIFLKKHGFKISIDDFGTMNSNFERVTLLNVDFIKIDGKFVKNIDKDEKSFMIVKAVTNFAKSIGAKVIAEFVSTKEIQEKILSLGIDYSQGYLFSEPKESL